MKAVLEFNYPQDTEKCRRAIHADEAFNALQEIRKSLDRRFTHKADFEDALKHVSEVTEFILKSTGEEV